MAKRVAPSGEGEWSASAATLAEYDKSVAEHLKKVFAAKSQALHRATALFCQDSDHYIPELIGEDDADKWQCSGNNCEHDDDKNVVDMESLILSFDPHPAAGIHGRHNPRALLSMLQEAMQSLVYYRESVTKQLDESLTILSSVVNEAINWHPSTAGCTCAGCK
jgi:hypothetical protein